MKRRILVASVLIGVAAFAADTGAELFQSAVTQERAAGNLEEAIKLYQRVATEFASDRALAAKALVQEARCYEKLGQDKATKLYEQVAHDYRDQAEPAATANSRLVALRQAARPASASITLRRIETPPGGSAFVAYHTDGQRMAGWDNAKGEVTISDLSGRNKRVIYKLKDRRVNSMMLSRDFSLVLLQLIRPDGTEPFAFVKTDGTGFRELPGDWNDVWGCNPEIAWDNRSVLFCKSQPKGEPEVIQVSVADGTIKNIGPMHGSQYRFSPDGKYIAYRGPAGIFVMSTEGYGGSEVAGRGFVDDWTRDGRFLIVDGLDSNADALYLIPVNYGFKQGNPVLVRYGAFRSYNTFYQAGRTLANGAFIYESTPPGGQYASWLGTLNAASGSIDWEKLSLAGGNREMRVPTWSPDSTQFAYVANDNAAGQLQNGVIHLRNVVSGEDRELYHGDAGQSCVWFGQSLLCRHVANGAQHWLSVSPDTGHAETLDIVPLREDLISLGRAAQNARSSDGIFSFQPGSRGTWKPPLVRTDMAQGIISPDGKSRVFHGRDAAGKDGLFRVAASGGQPERLGDFPVSNMRGEVWVSPDGQKLIVDALNPLQLWMLENFEPKQ